MQDGANPEIPEVERHNRKADLAPRVDKKDAFQATKQSVGSIFDIN